MKNKIIIGLVSLFAIVLISLLSILSYYTYQSNKLVKQHATFWKSLSDVETQTGANFTGFEVATINSFLKYQKYLQDLQAQQPVKK